MVGGEIHSAMEWLRESHEFFQAPNIDESTPRSGILLPLPCHPNAHAEFAPQITLGLPSAFSPIVPVMSCSKN
jgi:hypothetical protein